MNLTQDWVGYLDRSYEQIKKSVLARISINAPELTDHSESNPLIIIASAFAGIGEMLNLYIDSNAREAFLGTARRYANVVRLAKLIDYNIKARGYATANLVFSLTDSSGNPTVAPKDIILPAGLVVTPANSSVPFRLIKQTKLPKGYTSVYGVVGQYSEVVGDILGNTSGTANQKISLSDKYVHNTLKITINGEPWYLYNSRGLMGSTTKGFVVDIDENQNAYASFGDGANGAIPPNGQTIYGDYWECEGSAGNLPPSNINSIQTAITIPAGITLSADNPDYSSGGADFESIDEIRDRAPRSIRTLDRAVTYQDYIDIAMQVIGVGAAEVKYTCSDGKYVYVYIAPQTQGVATPALVSMVKEHFEFRRMITTQVVVNPAGISKIWIKAKVYGKPLYTQLEIQNNVAQGLDENFGTGSIKINRRVSITDIITAMEVLQTVDTFEIDQVRIEPYARPVRGTTSTLNIEFPKLPVTTSKSKYSITYKSVANKFELYKEGIFVTLLDPGQSYADGAIVTLKPLAGVYLDGDSWDFYIFPSYPEIFPTTTITIDDYTVPSVVVDTYIDSNTPRAIYSDLTFITQGSNNNTGCTTP